MATHQPIGQPLTTQVVWGTSVTVTDVTFSPDGKTLASVDGSIFLWDINPESWLEKACQRVARNFTCAEWEKFGFNEPYRATCEQWPLEP